MVFCKQCGFEIKDNSLKKCPKCNTTVGKGGRFCSDCGKKLNSGEKCDCLSNIPSEKCESIKKPIQNKKNADSAVIGAVPKQVPYIAKEEQPKEPTEVNKRIAGNPLLEKIARGESTDKSKEIIRNEAVKIVYGKDMTVDKLREQRAAELKAEEEKRLAEQKLEEQKKAEEQRRIEEEKRIKEQKQAEEKKRIETERKRIEAEKQARHINPAPPYPIDTLRQSQTAPQTRPRANIQNQPANTQAPPQLMHNFNTLDNANDSIKSPTSVQNNAEDSKNLFPEAFASQNMSYQKPDLGNVQHGPTSTQGKPIRNKSEKVFDGMWVAGVICTLAAFRSISLIITILLLVISTVFGIVDIFLNKKKTGIGVVIGNVVAFVTFLLSSLI